MPLSASRILAIAEADAEVAYGELTMYRTTLSLHPDGWHVSYDIDSLTMAGGGPHYIIDPTSGAILWKRYYQ